MLLHLGSSFRLCIGTQDHADRPDTHQVSAIINVDQDLESPWPLDIIGHNGRLTKVRPPNWSRFLPRLQGCCNVFSLATLPWPLDIIGHNHTVVNARGFYVCAAAAPLSAASCFMVHLIVRCCVSPAAPPALEAGSLVR